MQRRAASQTVNAKWNESVRHEDWLGIVELINSNTPEVNKYISDNARNIGDPFIFGNREKAAHIYDKDLATATKFLVQRLFELKREGEAYRIINEILYERFQNGMRMLNEDPEFCSLLTERLRIKNENQQVDLELTCTELLILYRKNRIQKAIEDIMRVMDPKNPDRVCQYLGVAANNLFAAYTADTPEAFVVRIFKYLDAKDQTLWDKAFQGKCWKLVNYILDLEIPGIRRLIRENSINIIISDASDDVELWTPLRYIAYENERNPNWVKNEDLVSIIRKLLELNKEDEETDHEALSQMIYSNAGGAYRVFAGHIPNRFLNVSVDSIPIVGVHNSVQFFGELLNGTIQRFLEIYGDPELETIDYYKSVPLTLNSNGQPQYRGLEFRQFPLAR